MSRLRVFRQTGWFIAGLMTGLLNLTRSVKYSDADRAEIQRQLTEQYISDYTATGGPGWTI